MGHYHHLKINFFLADRRIDANGKEEKFVESSDLPEVASNSKIMGSAPFPRLDPGAPDHSSYCHHFLSVGG